MTWFSFVGSTALFNKTTKVVMFQLENDKKYKRSMKQFTQILNIPNIEPFYEVATEQIVHIFNEMGHQPPLTKISYFKKSSLPYIWNLLFGIFLRCLTGRRVGLDKANVEVDAMVAGLYYDLQVDSTTQLWQEFGNNIAHTNVVKGVFVPITGVRF